MLKILDQYIIKKYLSTFFFTAMLFALVSVTIDFTERIDEFVKHLEASKEARLAGVATLSHGAPLLTVSKILTDYYPNFVFNIAGLLWPLYALITVIFFTSRMAYNAEIISILNAGVSFNRLLRPYLIAAGIVTALHLYGNHVLIPKGNTTRIEFENNYIYLDNKIKSKKNKIHLFLSKDMKIFINDYYMNEKDTNLQQVRLERFENGELRYLLNAFRVDWESTTKKWRFSDYEIRTFNHLNESLLVSQGKQLDTTLNFHPSDIVRYSNFKEMMTTGEMTNFIRKERLRGLEDTRKYEIEILRRYADALTILILTIIGVSVASRKVRGGMGFHLAVGIAVGALFVFLSRFSTAFALDTAVPVWLGVWAPNLIFGIVALFLVKNAQK